MSERLLPKDSKILLLLIFFKIILFAGARILFSLKNEFVKSTPSPVSKLSGKNGNEVKLEDEAYVLVRESEIAMVSTK